MGKNIPFGHKIYQMGKNIPIGHKKKQNVNKIYQHLPLQDPPKFTPIGIFGLKMNTIWQPWEASSRNLQLWRGGISTYIPILLNFDIETIERCRFAPMNMKATLWWQSCYIC
jgi:hypothetical protein